MILPSDEATDLAGWDCLNQLMQYLRVTRKRKPDHHANSKRVGLVRVAFVKKRLAAQHTCIGKSIECPLQIAVAAI